MKKLKISIAVIVTMLTINTYGQTKMAAQKHSAKTIDTPTAALEEMKMRAFADLTRKQKPSESIAIVMQKYENSIQFIKRFEIV